MSASKLKVITETESEANRPDTKYLNPNTGGLMAQFFLQAFDFYV